MSSISGPRAALTWVTARPTNLARVGARQEALFDQHIERADSDCASGGGDDCRVDGDPP
jgi:hypothetical protein